MRKISLDAVAGVKNIVLALVITMSFTVNAQDADPMAGKKLFNANCAACHKLNKKAVGPALKGVSAKYDKEWLYSWIKNSSAMIKAGDAQAVAIWEEYNKSAMTAFPLLSNVDIDNILAYTDYTPPAPAVPVATASAAAPSGESFSNDIILGALALVFGILVMMLILVNRTLQKIAAAQGVELATKEEKPARRPLWQAFAQNQFLVLISVVFLLLSSAYFAYGYFMQVGVDQGYMPVQPDRKSVV